MLSASQLSDVVLPLVSGRSTTSDMQDMRLETWREATRGEITGVPEHLSGLLTATGGSVNSHAKVVADALGFALLCDVERNSPVWYVRVRTHAVVALITRSHRGTLEVLAVRQFRPALGLDVWELPAGGIDVGESAADAAAREVREETGLQVQPVDARLLGSYVASSGLSDQTFTLFEFTEAEATTARPADEGVARDTSEVDNVAWLPVDRLIGAGTCLTSHTLTPLLISDRTRRVALDVLGQKGEFA